MILCADQLNDEKQKKLAGIIHDNSPNLNLVVDRETLHYIEKYLLRDKAHVGIFPCFQKVEGLCYKPISSEPIYLCCSAQHPLFTTDDETISPDILASTLAIHPGIDINAAGREQLKKLQPLSRPYEFDTRKAMILSGRYIGYLPQSYIHQELNHNEIRIIHANTMSYLFELSMVYKRSPREGNKVDLVKRAFSEVF